PPHVWGALHVPQLSMKPPQVSPAGPQVKPCSWHVFGTHTATPHLLGPPPPQVSPALSQLPQSCVLPQPSVCVPHSAPRSAHVTWQLFVLFPPLPTKSPDPLADLPEFAPPVPEPLGPLALLRRLFSALLLQEQPPAFTMPAAQSAPKIQYLRMVERLNKTF